MNIVIVSQYFYPENFRINDLAIELKNKGHSVTVLTGIPNYPQGQYYEGYKFRPYIEDFKGIKIIRSPLIPRGDKSVIKLVLNYLSFPFFASIMSILLARKQVDKIFVYGASPIFLVLPAIILKFFTKAPLVLWIQDLWPESLKASGLIKNNIILSCVGYITTLIYAGCDNILITSKGFKKSIENYDITNTPIDYLPQWGESFFEETNIRKNINVENLLPAGFKILFAGNIGFAQNMEIFVRAAQRLAAYKDIQFVLLGDGRERQRLEELAKEKNLENIHFLGSYPLENMPNFFQAADILFLSLISDPMLNLTVPGKIQAYLASARPIITAIDGAASSVIERAKAGLIGDSSDIDRLVKNILTIYKMTPEQRSTLGENARAYYDDNFKREKIISKLEGILQSEII